MVKRSKKFYEKIELISTIVIFMSIGIIVLSFLSIGITGLIFTDKSLICFVESCNNNSLTLSYDDKIYTFDNSYELNYCMEYIPTTHHICFMSDSNIKLTVNNSYLETSKIYNKILFIIAIISGIFLILGIEFGFRSKEQLSQYNKNIEMVSLSLNKDKDLNNDKNLEDN